MRLAALMHLPVIQVYTHDSIGLGEDGPTHQPVEHLAHLRATPNINVVRPADANETALAWVFALEQEDGPCALVLSRQNLPILDPDAVPDDAISRGAYTLRESSKGADPDVILIGTGSEVSICIEAAEALEADGLATRVVSMPCFDRFIEQDDGYRDTVLPPSVPGPGLGRGRGDLRMGALDHRGRRGRGHDGLRRLGPAARPVRALRIHARARGGTRPSGGRAAGRKDMRGAP